MNCLVGFRFKPTDEEIICLLEKKRLEPDFSVQTVKEIDFYSFDPWELPTHSGIAFKERIWYFYYKPYYKYAKSNRSHRRTSSGYWKITGQGSDMKAKNRKDVIGRKRILSFYNLSKEAMPEWVMHEIYIKDDPRYKEDFVVCRLERKRDNKPPSISISDHRESSPLVVAEDTSPKSVLPPNYNALDNDSFSELQLPIYLEQVSSYSNNPSNGCDLLNSRCDSDQIDDLINSTRGFQNEYSCVETGPVLTPEFYSTSGGNEMDSENIAVLAWVDTLFEN